MSEFNPNNQNVNQEIPVEPVVVEEPQNNPYTAPSQEANPYVYTQPYEQTYAQPNQAYQAQPNVNPYSAQNQGQPNVNPYSATGYQQNPNTGNTANTSYNNQYAQQPQYNQYAQAPYQQMYAQPQKKSGLEIAALICGIASALLAWFGWAALVALGAGIAAIVLAVKSGKKTFNGKMSGMALAGLICGIIGAVVSIPTILCTILCVAASATLPSYLY